MHLLFMTNSADQPLEPPSVPPVAVETAPDLLDLLIPADLPDLLPAHPDDFAGDNARPDIPA